MESLTQLISKLDKVTYTSVDGKTLIGEVKREKFAVSLALNMDESGLHLINLPIQAVFQIRINDQYIQSWGSDSNEMNGEMVTWFVKKCAVVNGTMYAQDSYDREQGKSLFASL